MNHLLKSTYILTALLTIMQCKVAITHTTHTQSVMLDLCISAKVYTTAKLQTL